MLNIENQGTDSPVRQAVLEIEAHVSDAGWDQPARLFALVSTAEILAAQPELAEQLGEAGFYTPVEQELPGDRQAEELLAEIGWPDEVAGCAVVLERLTLPPEAEAELPEDPAEAYKFVASHPQKQEMRIVAAVARDGSEHAAIRARGPEDAPLLEGPGLLPGLIDLLTQTFAED